MAAVVSGVVVLAGGVAAGLVSARARRENPCAAGSYAPRDDSARDPLTRRLRQGYASVEIVVWLDDSDRLLVGGTRDYTDPGAELERLILRPLADRIETYGRPGLRRLCRTVSPRHRDRRTRSGAARPRLRTPRIAARRPPRRFHPTRGRCRTAGSGDRAADRPAHAPTRAHRRRAAADLRRRHVRRSRTVGRAADGRAAAERAMVAAFRLGWPPGDAGRRAQCLASTGGRRSRGGPAGPFRRPARARMAGARGVLVRTGRRRGRSHHDHSAACPRQLPSRVRHTGAGPGDRGASATRTADCCRTRASVRAPITATWRGPSGDGAGASGHDRPATASAGQAARPVSVRHDRSMTLRDVLRVAPGTAVNLDSIDPGGTPGFPERKKGRKSWARQELVELGGRLETLQEQLFATAKVGETRKRVLIVLQAMDCGGKDGTVRKVVGTMNPQGLHDRRLRPADEGGVGARLPVADPQGRAGARADRRVQPVALRGRAGRARARPGAEADVAGSVREDQRFRDGRWSTTA